jgi:hypothetical protein
MKKIKAKGLLMSAVYELSGYFGKYICVKRWHDKKRMWIAKNVETDECEYFDSLAEARQRFE